MMARPAAPTAADVCAGWSPGRALAAGAAAALVLLVAFASDWVARLPDAISNPTPRFDAWGADARLVVRILAWVAHALARAPERLLDANIFHPADGMLAGSEHFIGAQVVFGPVYAATGNAVLASNVYVVVSYVVTGATAAALVAGWDVGRAPAVAAAALLAVGVFRVPIDTHHALQHPNLCPAALWLAVDRWRRTGRGAAFFGATLGLVLAASYYAAATGIATVACLAAALAVERRTALAARVLLVTAVLTVAMLAASLPYLEAASLHAADAARLWQQNLTVRKPLLLGVAVITWEFASPWPFALAAVTAPWWAADRPRRALVGTALLLVAAGLLGSVATLLVPSAVVDLLAHRGAGVLLFFRYGYRMLVLADVGATALAAIGRGAARPARAHRGSDRARTRRGAGRRPDLPGDARAPRRAVARRAPYVDPGADVSRHPARPAAGRGMRRPGRDPRRPPVSGRQRARRRRRGGTGPRTRGRRGGARRGRGPSGSTLASRATGSGSCPPVRTTCHATCGPRSA